jgi:stress-induced-phosphoprotein 1
MAKLQMLQTNPQAMLQDPEVMEIFGLLMGEKDGEGEDTPAAAPRAAAPKWQEPVVELDPKEAAAAAAKQNSKDAKDRGNALYKNKQFDEALVAYDEAIALDATNVMVMNNKAAVYIEQGEFDKAIEECTLAVDKGRLNRTPYPDMAKLFHRMATG